MAPRKPKADSNPRPKPTPKPKKPAFKEPRETKTKITMFTSKRLSLYHPYQNIRFTPDVPTAAILDSWMESQIRAGLIEAVK